MKLGIGLYKSLLNYKNFQFAKQTGATHLVVQLVDYIQGGNNPSLTRNYLNGWGVTENEHRPWTLDQLKRINKEIESHGLVWEAIENFDPAHWFDILLDGPKKETQLENLKRTIQHMGKVGISILGYYFSIAGVWGWTCKETGRGGANSIEFDQSTIDIDEPISNGMVWNMVYDKQPRHGFIPEVSQIEMWERLNYFLRNLLPIAEENGVRLAAHPDDPPLPTMRRTGRLFHSLEEYDKLMNISDSDCNTYEMCLGTMQEMASGDVYEFLEKHIKSNNVAYIHYRNVIGKVPAYREAFVDEGDLDMVRVLQILKKNNFNGMIIPDHTPEISSDAPWHAGMAFAMGYMKGAIQALNK